MASPLFAGILWIILTFLGVSTSDPDQRPLNSSLVFLGEPQDVIAVKNSPLWLPCTVDSSQDGGSVSYSWQHDGEAVSDSRLTVLPNGTLYISRVIHKVNKGRSDEGFYSCYVKNDHGTIFSSPAKVTVAALQSRVTVVPSTTSANQGELVRFQCQVHGSPSPDISWERNRQPLPQDKRYVLLPSGILQMSNVNVEDEGMYRCRAVNLARERHSTEVKLTVTNDGSTKAPSLLVGPQDLSIVTGQSAMLECGVTGLPQPQIVWTREDGELLPPSRHTIVGLGNLQVANVQPSDAGVYICSAGSVMSQATLTVLVPPNATTSEPVYLAKPSARTVRFQCIFSGSPAPTINWYKDGKLIEADGRTKIRTEGEAVLLIITNTEPADSGYYQCVGHNEAGQSSLIMRLLIYFTDQDPNPPRDLKADQHSSTSIAVRWKVPRATNNNDNLGIVAYSIHYTPVQGGPELQKVTKDTAIVVTDLKPHTNYGFYVVAYNQVAASIHSETVTQITDDDVPKVAPEPQVSAVGSTSVLVQWEPIPPDKARGEIVKYKVIYRKAGSAEQMSVELESSAREYSIENLEPDQRYEVRVTAATRKGYPNGLDDSDWPWHAQITNNNSNVGLPEMPKILVRVINSTAVEVKWEEPKVISMPDEDVLGYKLRFHKPLEEPKLTILVPEQRDRTITKLEPDTEYEISVLAFTATGDGSMTTKTVTTMPRTGGVPAPMFLHSEPLNDSAIKVTWKAPLEATMGAITYYSLRYQQKPVPHDVTDAKEIISNANSVVVGHLQPYQEYTFSVRAHTKTKAGPFSDRIACRTKEGLPSAPRYAMAEVLGPSIVELQWQPPQFSNGVILTYVIYYTIDDSSPENVWMTKQENGTVMHAVLNDLHSEAYLFKMVAATSAGKGPPTDIIKIEMRVVSGSSGTSDRNMGIIVGVGIGGGCIIICAIIILLRNRCFPPRHLPVDPASDYPRGNGYIPKANGDVIKPNHINHDRCAVHEMDSILPMLPHISENENSDTKGGSYAQHNGRPLNGLNGLQNGIPPDGKYRFYRIQDHDCCEDGLQVPLRNFSLHGDILSEEPITVQLSSLEDIDRNYIAETDIDAHMKASPSSSGVTDCTQGPILEDDSNVSSQTASLERSGYSSARSTGSSRKGHPSKNRNYKKARSQSSPHSTLSNSSASSSTSTPTTMVNPVVQELEGGDLRDAGVHHVMPQGTRPMSGSHHPQQPVSMSVLTHVSSQGHGPGRPREAEVFPATCQCGSSGRAHATGWPLSTSVSDEQSHDVCPAGQEAALSRSQGGECTSAAAHDGQQLSDPTTTSVSVQPGSRVA